MDNLDLKQELKSVTTQLEETEKILDELQTEDAQLRSKLASVQKELSNARTWRVENEPRILSLEKENRVNSGAIIIIHLNISIEFISCAFDRSVIQFELVSINIKFVKRGIICKCGHHPSVVQIMCNLHIMTESTY